MLKIVILCLTFFHHVNSAKILGVFAMPSPSHYFLGSTMMRALAEKGHQVTVISPYGEKNLPSNITYRDILLTGAVEEKDAQMKKINMNMFDREKVNPYLTIIFMTKMMIEYHEKVLAHENVQNLIKSGETFDVIIVEQFINDALKAMATHFKANLISFSTLGATSWTSALTGSPSPPSYISEALLNLNSPMTFWDRLHNFSFSLFSTLLSHLYAFPRQNEIIKKYFPDGPELDQVLYNSSIVLLNSHPSVKKAVPLAPNAIEIGGFHVRKPKPLPKHLQEFLDAAGDHGAIYFSLGSNLNCADMPEDKKKALIRTFAKLKQKVLWKCEDEQFTDKPINVLVSKWMPQQDILAHPNVKLFISHMGLLSTTETIYHGVPILAIPIFGDQKMNAKSAVDDGIGLSLPFDELNEETLTWHIAELINNKKYGEQAKVKSEMFHDRPIMPLDLAIYWIEYVARNGGAPHLKLEGLKLTWYQYHLLDVIGFFAVCIFIFVRLIWVLCRRLKRGKIHTYRTKKLQQSETKKKN